MKTGIVDDSGFMRLVLKKIISKNSELEFVWDASDGIEAIDKNVSNPADLIISDMEMPRMDGFEFIEEYMQLHKKSERKPILVYSGKDLSEVQKDLLEKNVTALIKKDDVSIEELSSVVKNIYKKII